jgi:hypothetical protein
MEIEERQEKYEDFLASSDEDYSSYKINFNKAANVKK